MLKKSLALLLGICLTFSLVGCQGSDKSASGQSGSSTQGSDGASESSAAGEDAGAGQTASTGDVTVSFYSWSAGAEQEFDQAICDQYQAEHPGVTIEANFIPYSEYLSKINTMAAADSMPEVFKLPEGSVLEWGTKGAVLDLEPLYEKAGFDPDTEMVSTTVFRAGDGIWGVGCNVTTLALYYNKEIFAQNGIEMPSTDAENPWTWDEFVENAKKLTKDTNGNTPNDEGFDEESVSVYGTMMPTDWNVFMPLMYTNDAGIANEEGTELLINTQAGLEVLQAIADLSLVHKCAPTVAMAKGAFSDKSAMLMNGQLAMAIDGAWALGNYANEGYDVGVAQIPMFKHPANMSWGAGVCMSPKSAQNEAAFDFFRYYTEFENAISTSENAGVALGGLPHTVNIFDGGENEKAWAATYTKVDESANCEAFKNILQQKDTRLGENVSLKNFPAIVDNTIVPLLDNVWLGETTAEEALSGLDVSGQLQGTWE